MKDYFKARTLLLIRSWAESKNEYIPDLRELIDTFINGTIAEQDRLQSIKQNGNRNANYQWLVDEHLLPVVTHIMSQAARDQPENLSKIIYKKLNDLVKLQAAHSLMLEITGRQVAGALNACHIDWAFIKGFTLARRVYGQPHLRKMVDIDVLVRKEDETAAIEALYGIGANKKTKTKELGHEKTLIINKVEIDLHTSPMRKCRMKSNPAHDWLGRGSQDGSFRYLSDHDNFVLSMVHPAITEYLTLRIARMLDVVMQVVHSQQPIDWGRVADDVKLLGLGNAAYVTGMRVNYLFSNEHGMVIPASFMDSLGVDRYRKKYWRYWMNKRPDKLYKSNRLLAKTLFSIWLNDNPVLPLIRLYKT